VSAYDLGPRERARAVEAAGPGGRRDVTGGDWSTEELPDSDAGDRARLERLLDDLLWLASSFLVRDGRLLDAIGELRHAIEVAVEELDS
jgi:hypothetical protein